MAAETPTAHDFPDCRPCQMWEDAGASWPRPCAKHSARDVPTVQRWMTLDLWSAVMGDDAGRYDFDEWYDRKGFGDAWASLCQRAREACRVA